MPYKGRHMSCFTKLMPYKARHMRCFTKHVRYKEKDTNHINAPKRIHQNFLLI